jgi:hypothetical protein
VNLDAKTVEIDGARVHLTGKEYVMLSTVNRQSPQKFLKRNVSRS